MAMMLVARSAAEGTRRRGRAGAEDSTCNLLYMTASSGLAGRSSLDVDAMRTETGESVEVWRRNDAGSPLVIVVSFTIL
jgi:hypothetical protein